MAEMRGWAPVVALVVLGLVIVGCGSQVAPTSSPAATSAAAQTPRSQAAGSTFREAWQASLPDRVDGASDFVRGIITDGIVTADEHEQAVIAFLTCMREAGITGASVERGAGGMIGQMAVPGPDSSTAVLACQRDTYTDVREGYKSTTFDPDGTEAGQLANLAHCMRDAGIGEVPDGSTMEQISEVVRRLRDNALDQRDVNGIYEKCLAKTTW